MKVEITIKVMDCFWIKQIHTKFIPTLGAIIVMDGLEGDVRYLTYYAETDLLSVNIGHPHVINKFCIHDSESKKKADNFLVKHGWNRLT